ncbi:MAG: ATP-dependent helicase [Chloroflexota bacterium]
MFDFTPRPKQQEVLKYRDGWMGVAAVPGAGKTRTLSALAAKILTETPMQPGEEVLIVTLVNAAVGNFSRQIKTILKQQGMIAGYDYRVRTLHGLANDIVRERPALVSLSDGFTIIDEREANEILEYAASAWLRGNPDALMQYVKEEFQERKDMPQRHLPRAVTDMARNFIRQSKDWMLSPVDVEQSLDAYKMPLPLAEMCAEIYARYQQSLNYRGGVDFQDLIRLALKALRDDPGYLERLQNRWRYILEDEAQDSDSLQEEILRTLAGNHGNWVRVGDPNQSIYETFTTADPRYLREFITLDGVQSRELPNSGRSQQHIMDLANQLIEWSAERHPNPAVRDYLPLTPPYIQPTPPGDPQPNPPASTDGIFLHPEGFPPAEEITIIVKSVRQWLKDNPEMTCAILTPRNQRGYDVVNALKQADVDYVEMLRSTTNTREVAGSIYFVMTYLADPVSSDKLARVYRVWRRDDKDDTDLASQIQNIAKLVRSCTAVETYINPQGTDWLDTVTADDPDLRSHLDDFRQFIHSMQEAASLPVDQLVLTIAGRIFHATADLAVAYSLSLRLRRDGMAQEQSIQLDGRAAQRWTLTDYAERLAEIAKNERKFLGMSEDEMGFDPDRHRGKVTVATMHGAKGLEWDRVYLMSVNTYNFPADEPGDSFIGEKWFAEDDLNMEAEARAQLEALYYHEPYTRGSATRAARTEYAAERLRLLYVGITRARRELVITWNTGRRGDQREAVPLIALRTWWETNKP